MENDEEIKNDENELELEEPEKPNWKVQLLVGTIILLFIGAVVYTFWAYSDEPQEEIVDNCTTHLHCTLENGYVTAENLDRNTTYDDWDKCDALDDSELPKTLCLEN